MAPQKNLVASAGENDDEADPKDDASPAAPRDHRLSITIRLPSLSGEYSRFSPPAAAICDLPRIGTAPTAKMFLSP